MASSQRPPLAEQQDTGEGPAEPVPAPELHRSRGSIRRVSWRGYQAWFWAATVYNVAWGTLVGLRPQLLLQWMGMTPAQQAAAGPLPLILSACVGMFVGVYAIGYACVALDPARFWPFALLGLCGKVLGPMGAVLHIALGHLPVRALWVNFFNDFLWWPAFAGLLLTVGRERRAGRIRL